MSTSNSNPTSDDESEPKGKSEHRVAKKSTNSSQQKTGYSTRRQLRKTHYKNTNKHITEVAAKRFMQNFNPDTSMREKRKLIKKINPPSTVRRPLGSVYDERGIHIATGMDLCDCLSEDCGGCFFECPKCDSTKCGTECRVHRKFIIDQIEYHGYDNVIKNPLAKSQY